MKLYTSSDNYMQSNALLGPVIRIRAWILLSTYEYSSTGIFESWQVVNGLSAEVHMQGTF